MNEPNATAAAPRLNWAGNYAYRAAGLHRPASLEDLQEMVARSPRVKALGTRHAFNGAADTEGDQVSLDTFGGPSLDQERGKVTVGAGVRYGELARFLQSEGFALHNLASLPHISVAGACSTATHGSGSGNSCLAAAVAAIEFVRADGGLVTLSREADGDRFHGAVVGLGALGIVTQLTLDLELAYEVRQSVYERLPLGAALSHFDEIMGAAYSVSLFTDWRSEGFHQVWLKHRGEAAALSPGSEWFGTRPAPEDLHPLPGMPARNCTPQRGVPGPWHERLPHFRLEFTPSSGAELQTEYLVPRENATAALRAISALRGSIAPLLQVAEVRTVAPDELWMSPFYKQPCAAFHFTWAPDWPAVSTLLPTLESELAPLGACPHWGKLSRMTGPQIAARFPRLSDFRDLVHECDPSGKFHNPFLDSVLDLRAPACG